MRYEEDLGGKGAAIIIKNWTDDRHKKNQLSDTAEEKSKMRRLKLMKPVKDNV